jgi:hypothetical protein
VGAAKKGSASKTIEALLPVVPDDGAGRLFSPEGTAPVDTVLRSYGTVVHQDLTQTN